MTFEISLEAIEADLALADRDPGGRLSNLALAKAQIRATLLAAMPSENWAPLAVDQASASEIQAALVFQQRAFYATHPDAREARIAELRDVFGVHPFEREQADAAGDLAGTIIDGPADPDEEPGDFPVNKDFIEGFDNDDDDDEDFFAEARRERD